VREEDGSATELWRSRHTALSAALYYFTDVSPPFLTVNNKSRTRHTPQRRSRAVWRVSAPTISRDARHARQLPPLPSVRVSITRTSL